MKIFSKRMGDLGKMVGWKTNALLADLFLILSNFVGLLGSAVLTVSGISTRYLSAFKKTDFYMFILVSDSSIIAR